MTNEEIREYSKLDTAAAELTGGVYVEPYDAAPDYDVRRIDEYCKLRGVSPETLTDEELKPFIRERKSA